MYDLIETYIIQVIKGQKQGIFPSIVKGILLVLSWFYQFFVFIRNWAYDQGLFRQYHPPVPMVISIGNIVAGGTGKTPVTFKLAEAFVSDFHTVIISRGYRAQAELLPDPVILSRGDGHGPFHAASFCGDEAYMLAQNLPEAMVIVGKDRRKATIMASKTGGQLVLLDDGMQHRRLARDFDVVVMDATNAFGFGHYLPRGFLRESLKSLARVDLIVLNHIYSDEKFLELKKEIEKYSKSPIIGVHMRVSGVWSLVERKRVELQGEKVGIFCAIANPEYFDQTVKSLGAEVVATQFARDHLDFKAQQLNEFATLCKNRGAKFLVCTEKDRVKICGFSQISLPIVWVQIQLDIVHGEYEWETFIAKIKSELVNRV